MEPDFERSARERDVVAGCYFLMFLDKDEGGDVEWAKDILSRSRFDGPQIEVCRGWCEILLGAEKGSLVSIHFFKISSLTILGKRKKSLSRSTQPRR